MTWQIDTGETRTMRLDDQLARQKYRDVRAPVTLIYGASDWSHSSERERTKGALPDARLITLDRAGDFSVLDQPAAWAQILTSAHNETAKRHQTAGRT